MRPVASMCLLAITICAACGGGNNSSPSSPSPSVTPTPTPTPTPNPAPGSTVSSCAGGSGASGTMSATINGTPWVAACIATSTYLAGIVGIGASDNAVDATHAQIIGMAAAATGPGTYTVNLISGTNGLLNIGGSQLWVANATTGSGSITFDTLTTSGGSGTFSFTLNPQAPATGTKTITNGVFNIKF